MVTNNLTTVIENRIIELKIIEQVLSVEFLYVAHLCVAVNKQYSVQ